MRARNENNVLSVHAIAGTHVVLLGLDVKGYNPDSSTDLSALLSGMALDPEGLPLNGTKSSTNDGGAFVGFAIDRTDVATKESTSLNADGRPIQKFHFNDYTVLPGRQYEYTLSFLSSSVQLVADDSSVTVTITTEDPTKGKHGIYFNRGVAGSKAYSKQFGEYRKYHLVKKFGGAQYSPIINPRSIPDQKKSKDALAWLSRGLEEALLQFISQATGKEYRLLATVYEFIHEETVQSFASAVERDVDVKIIRHCKGSYRTRVKGNNIVKDESGKIVKDWIPDNTTDSAMKAINAVGFDSLEHAHTWHHNTFIERKHSSGLMHNKFIILVKHGKPVQVVSGGCFSCHLI